MILLGFSGRLLGFICEVVSADFLFFQIFKPL